MDLKDRLQDVIERRDIAQSKIQTIKGRLEAALSERKRIESECRKKGIEPDRLSEIIQELEKKLDEEITEFEIELGKAERSLATFLKDE